MWGLVRSAASFLIAPSQQPARSFKIVSALQRRCQSCRIVRRGKKIYVLCEENPRHKQRQGKKGSVYRKHR